MRDRSRVARFMKVPLAEAGLTLDYKPPRAERPILAQEPVLIRRVPVLMASK